MRSPQTIDPSQMFAAYASARSNLSSDRHRTILDVIVDHFEAELVTCDIDRLMGTLTPQPEYRFYGIARPTLIGYDAIRAFYEESFTVGPGQSAITNVDNVIVGDNGAVIEGDFSVLKSRGSLLFPEFTEVLDNTREWMLHKRLSVVYPFRDELIFGENIYFDGDFTASDVEYLDGDNS